jgi:hypothetical protein
MSCLSNYNTFNITPGKLAYLCSIKGALKKEMVQVFDYIVIAYITLRTFTEINFKKTFIQGEVIGSS